MNKGKLIHLKRLTEGEAFDLIQEILDITGWSYTQQTFVLEMVLRKRKKIMVDE